MGNRVVVTGLGCISPLGNDVPTTWEACSNGKSGIEKITHFDPEALRCQIAGEVKNFQLPDIIPPKEAKKWTFLFSTPLKPLRRLCLMQI